VCVRSGATRRSTPGTIPGHRQRRTPLRVKPGHPSPSRAVCGRRCDGRSPPTPNRARRFERLRREVPCGSPSHSRRPRSPHSPFFASPCRPGAAAAPAHSRRTPHTMPASGPAVRATSARRRHRLELGEQLFAVTRRDERPGGRRHLRPPPTPPVPTPPTGPVSACASRGTATTARPRRRCLRHRGRDVGVLRQQRLALRGTRRIPDALALRLYNEYGLGAVELALRLRTLTSFRRAHTGDHPGQAAFRPS